MIEKRKFPRYKAKIKIKYKRLDDPLSEWQAEPEVKNISLGGLLFSAYEEFPVGTQLLFKLEIVVENLAARIIEIKARVIGVEDGIISYDTRVAFIEFDNATKASLEKFIKYLNE